LTSRTRLDPHRLSPTLAVGHPAEILGGGRTLAYELIRPDEFPTQVVRLGSRRT
jgi:hypothetical protein